MNKRKIYIVSVLGVLVGLYGFFSKWFSNPMLKLVYDNPDLIGPWSGIDLLYFIGKGSVGLTVALLSILIFAIFLSILFFSLTQLRESLPSEQEAKSLMIGGFLIFLLTIIILLVRNTEGEKQIVLFRSSVEVGFFVTQFGGLMLLISGLLAFFGKDITKPQPKKVIHTQHRERMGNNQYANRGQQSNRTNVQQDNRLRD